MSAQRWGQRPLALAALGIGLALSGAGWAQPAASAPPAPAPAAPVAQQKNDWESFPTMLLEKVYRGPLRDTIVQRWRDPIDGTVCFLYLPISAPLSPQSQSGYAQYGPNQIGSISCIHTTEVVQIWQGTGAPPVPGQAAPKR